LGARPLRPGGPSYRITDPEKFFSMDAEADSIDQLRGYLDPASASASARTPTSEIDKERAMRLPEAAAAGA
jgi:hypothetical protein